jgi:phosphoglycolate phosphatase
MVGDTKYDILGANDAGVPSVAVTFGFGSIDEMIVAGATYVAKNCEDIKNIVFG